MQIERENWPATNQLKRITQNKRKVLEKKKKKTAENYGRAVLIHRGDKNLGLP
jgi:hypothetical protein